MEECIFCKIIKGEIPCYKIAENEEFIAFLDIRPYTPGHTLVVPKKHFRWVYEIENVTGFWNFANTIVHQLNSTLNPDFVTLLTVGNEVEHAHLHLIPRYPQDNFTGLFNDNLRLNSSSEDLQKIAVKINP